VGARAASLWSSGSPYSSRALGHDELLNAVTKGVSGEKKD